MNFLNQLANGFGTLLGVLADTTVQVISGIKQGYETYKRQGGTTGADVVDEITRKKDRPACHGTITSAPAWVSRSTVSSDRAAFGRAWITVTVGRRAGSLATQSTTPVSRSFPETPVTVMTARVPWPSTSSICSPTPVRFTLTACRPSSPVSSITSPTVGGVGNSCT